jgi:hypothetical protein
MSVIELEKQVSELKAELATLRDALDKAFRELGASAIWHHYNRQAKEINAATLAAQLNESAPTPQSAVLTTEDIKGIKRELFGTDEVLLSVEQIRELAKR